MAKVIKWVDGLVMDALDSADTARYNIDLSSFLGSDAITSASSLGTDITVSDTAFSGQNVTILVTSGIISKRAKVRFTVSTAVETFNRSFYIPIKSL
jgi:hypothetical protein